MVLSKIIFFFVFMCLSFFTSGQISKGKVFVGVEAYHPLYDKNFRGYKYGYRFLTGYEKSVDKFDLSFLISFSKFQGRNYFDNVLYLETPSFTLFGAGSEFSYYVYRDFINLFTGYNAHVTNFDDPVLVNEFSFGTGLTFEKVKIKLGLNSFFNSGMLNNYKLGLVYNFGLNM